MGIFGCLTFRANPRSAFCHKMAFLSQIIALGFEPFGKKADTLRQLAMALLERTK